MTSETAGAREPRVVIVGGGFAGLTAAKALRKTPARIFLIDRTNHHLFQPLLYQVATSVLSPGHIGFPIRGLLRKQKNATVLMAEVTGVDKEQRCVFVNDADRQRVPIPYDYLVLATGVSHSYFGHSEFEKYASGLKSLADAVAIRNKILQALEEAEAEADPSRHRDLLTFVLVGAGPTGVEMAGAIAVLVRNTLRSEFRRIDPASTRIVLVDMANRVLSTFSESLSNAAQWRLEKLGVEVRLGRGADQIDENGVIVAGERITSRTVIWTAGVAPLCRKADSLPHQRQICAATVSILRQRQHGRGRQGLRDPAKRPHSACGTVHMARVGIRPLTLSRSARTEDHCLHAMGVDIDDRPARLAPNRKSSWICAGNGGAKCGSGESDRQWSRK